MIHRCSLSIVLLISIASLAGADDWPQWRGPDRNSVSREKGLLATWPKDGPKLLWTVKDAGLGFSAPVVVGKTVFLCGTRDEKEDIIIALDLDTGKRLWTWKIGELFTFKANQWGDGPRGSPAVDGNLLFALGGRGDLVCVDFSDKSNVKEVWRKNSIKDFGGQMMSEWGYAESPLVDGDLLICTPGGAKGTLAALDKRTGEVKWRTKELDHKSTYASIVAANIHGVRQYIFLGYVNDLAGAVVCSVAADGGKLLWSMPIFKGKSYAVCSSPVVKDNFVYVTAGYGMSCHLFEIDKTEKEWTATDKYSRDIQQKVKNLHGGVVLVGDHIYGHTEGRDVWICQEFKTGNIVWKKPTELKCKSGSITSAEGLLYLYSDEGEAVLLKADPKEWTEVSRFKIPQTSAYRESGNRTTSQDSKVWTHPVIANGRLFLRDNEFVFCYDIRAGK